MARLRGAIGQVDRGPTTAQRSPEGPARVDPAALGIRRETAGDHFVIKPVVAGEMVGTVKIIPYAIPRLLLQNGIVRAGKGALRIVPYSRRTVGVVSTLLPNLKPSVIDETLAVLGRRLEPAQARIAQERRVPHEAAILVEELALLAGGHMELIIVFGASAIADRREL